MKTKIAIVLFFIALIIRLSFYFIAANNLPDNIQKFVTADTSFYYDPLALKMASGDNTAVSLLSVTRCTFLGYLSLFYRFFGYHYWPVSIFHCFLGSITVVMLFLTAQLFFRLRTAFIIGLVSAFQLVLVYWSPFVTTETAFFLILSLFLFIFALFIKTRRSIYLFPLTICLAVILISRPAGMLFSVFMFLYLMWLVFKRIFTAKAGFFFFVLNSVVLVALIGSVAVFSRTIDKIISQPYPQTVLFTTLYPDEMPDTKHRLGYLGIYGVRLTLLPGTDIPKTGHLPEKIMTNDIASYFKKHYVKYLILTISRAYTLFNPWVPEYSFRHNIFNFLFYGTIYILSIIGLMAIWAKERSFAGLILVGLASQVLLISLTVVDYDFRLRLPIELILTIPVGAGIAKILNIREHRL